MTYDFVLTAYRHLIRPVLPIRYAGAWISDDGRLHKTFWDAGLHMLCILPWWEYPAYGLPYEPDPPRICGPGGEI